MNVLFFFLIFPILVSSLSKTNLPTTGLAIESTSNIVLEVDIPCPGHAPLIIDELKKVDGILSVTFDFPNIFSVTFDSKIVSKEKILSQEVFSSFKARLKE